MVAHPQSQPLAFRPGTRTGYRNAGYVVLGEIIEYVSRMNYAAFLRRHLFAPLAMAHTGVYQGQPIGFGHALGYLADGSVAPAYLTADSSSAGATYSTAIDLYRWDQALITGKPRLVAPPLLRQILTVHAPCPYRSCPLAADRGYGYGWFAARTPPATLVNHSRSVRGVLAYNRLYPAPHTLLGVLGHP